MTDEKVVAHPPETIEGWYALHQIFRNSAKGPVLQSGDAPVIGIDIDHLNHDVSEGWTAVVELIGSIDQLMVIHFRRTLDEIQEAQASAGLLRHRHLELSYSFLSVTEAGLYHITAQLAAGAKTRGGSVGDEEYKREIADRIAVELESDHVKRRLFPPLPGDMPYVCFYPMSKRRDAGQNWYTLSLEERSRLMHAHGLTGRRYAGRVQQIISGAIGFENWEWGVTLFAKDPLDFKKIVTDMRFDEVSAKYAEFGQFYVGKVLNFTADP